jgi:hypothetical protein
MFGFRKNKQLYEKLDRYYSELNEVMDLFDEAFDYFLKHGPDDKFELMVNKLHQHESEGDDLRREIEIQMYSESLLPESRGDMLGLIESMDYVPGKAQSILWQIATQNIEMPDYLKMDMEELVSISRNTFFSVLTAVRDIMGKRRRVMELTQIIDNNESLCDDLERKMIRKIFQNDQPTADKILLKELVLELGEITDLCEKISDRITIFNVKRQV